MTEIKKNSKWNKFVLDEYEFERLQFLTDILVDKTQGEKISLNNLKYVHDNKMFLKNLDDKLIKNITPKNNFIYENYFNGENDRTMKNLEFFKIIGSFSKKYENMYYKKTKKLYEDLLSVYLPLTRFLYRQSMVRDSGIIIGVQAHQGSGKTTFCNIVGYLSNFYDLSVNSLSIDDMYRTFDELNKIKKEDKRFCYRGPPGTHDISIGKEILENVKNLKTFYKLPRYDKSANNGLGDRASHGVKVLRPMDILIFEGWFLGAEPVEEIILEQNNKNLKSLEFQKLINKHLYEYKILWDYVDYWMILKPFQYEYSKKWRNDAEKHNKQKMNYKTLQEFINYFWESVPPYIYFPRIEKTKSPILIIAMDLERNFYL